MHKTHTEDKKAQEEEEDEEKTKKKATASTVLEEGTMLSQVKVKEINYFDGVPIISSKNSILTSKSLNYDMINPGDFFDAKIEKVDKEHMCVHLSINPFVKGKLNLEHMAESYLKVIPPKFTEVGKEIRVRVFNVNAGKR